MGFPGLDGTFGSVATMIVGGDALEVYCVFGEGCFHIFGALVIKNMELGCVYIGLEIGVGCKPSITDGASLDVAKSCR